MTCWRLPSVYLRCTSTILGECIEYDHRNTMAGLALKLMQPLFFLTPTSDVKMLTQHLKKKAMKSKILAKGQGFWCVFFDASDVAQCSCAHLGNPSAGVFHCGPYRHYGCLQWAGCICNTSVCSVQECTMHRVTCRVQGCTMYYVQSADFRVTPHTECRIQRCASCRVLRCSVYRVQECVCSAILNPALCT